MPYIQLRYKGRVETIDEAETHKEALALLGEYRLAYKNEGHVYLSRRPCRDWNHGSTSTDPSS